MADTPTPRSYRVPPIHREGPTPIDPYREGLADITTLLFDVRSQIKNLRNEIEELKLIEEKTSKKGGTIPPMSMRSIVTRKRAIVAALLTVLTILLDQLATRLREDQKGMKHQEESQEDGTPR